MTLSMTLRRPLWTLAIALTAGAGCADPGGVQQLVPADALIGDSADTAAPGDTLSGGDGTTGVDTAIADATADTADTATVDTTPADTVVAPDGGPVSLGVGVLISEVDAPLLNLAITAARLTRVPVPADTSGTSYPPCRVARIDPNAAEPVRVGLDAGVITVTGTTPTVTFTPFADGAAGTGYSSNIPSDQQNLLPGGGAIVTFAASGGAEVASWSGVLQMPEPVTISLPATGFGQSEDPSRALTVVWNKGTGQQVVVSLSPISSTGQAIAGKAIFCELTGDAGTVTIPAAALTEAADGPSAPLMALGVTRLRVGRAQNAGHIVPLTATRSSGGPLQLGQ